MEKITVSEFFSEFLKLLQSYGDIIIRKSNNFNDGRMSFECHIMSSALMADLMYICYATNTASIVNSYDLSEPGESPEDSFKRLIWNFFFRPHRDDKKLNEKILPFTLFDFYTLVLRDMKKKKLISEEEIAYFENLLAKVDSKLQN